MFRVLTLLSLAALPACIGPASPSPVGQSNPKPVARVLSSGGDEVPLWQPRDFTFASNAAPANPFTVDFSATVTGPAGSFTLPGFYNGDNQWVIRVSPTVVGAWSLVTHSDAAPDLDGHQENFAAVDNPAPLAHGPLLVDRDHPNHFVYEDGTRYFMMGYECDWCWALGLQEQTTTQLETFLDKLAAAKFNQVLVTTYAYDTSWRSGHTGPDDYGPPPVLPWLGTNADFDFSRFNLAYWQHFDQMIAALNDRGLIAHLYFKVYNKFANWPVNDSAEDNQFYTWVVARYAAYPHIIWDLAKEANRENDTAYKLGRIAFLKSTDPYHHLRTSHTDTGDYDQGLYAKPELNFRSDQLLSNLHAAILRQRQAGWPAANVEFGYECGPKGLNDKTFDKAQTPEDLVDRAWQIYSAGGYGAYNYTYTAWDVIRPTDTPPGYAYFQNLLAFFATTNYWLLTPADAIVTVQHSTSGSAYALANPGKEYVVYMTAAQPMTLKVQGSTGTLTAKWYDTRQGLWLDAGSVGNGTVSLSPPSGWGNVPVALHVVRD